MDPQETLTEVEAQYRRILELTLRQEQCLTAGQLDALSPLVAEKLEILSHTEALMHMVGAAADRSDSVFQEGVQRLAGVLAEVVASEERCKALAPSSPAPTQPAPARVLAAYGRR